jgi:hypothetical protein
MNEFNMESSAMISGKWINRQTGDIVNVRDSIIDGDNMIIITDRGQIDLPTFSNNYIQASDDIYDENGNKIGTEKLNTNEIVNASRPVNLKQAKKNELAEYELIDEIVSEKNTGNTQVAKAQEEPSIATIVETPKTYDIIDKVFSKINVMPNIHVDINWNEMPMTQIDTLINYLDVPVEDVAGYIIMKYVNADRLTNEIAKHLSNNNAS